MTDQYSEGIALAAPTAVEAVQVEAPVVNGGSIDPEVAQEMAPVVKAQGAKKAKAQAKAAEVASEGVYTMIENVKHNGTKYLAGQKVDLDDETAKLFTLNGFIQ